VRRGDWTIGDSGYRRRMQRPGGPARASLRPAVEGAAGPEGVCSPILCGEIGRVNCSFSLLPFLSFSPHFSPRPIQSSRCGIGFDDGHCGSTAGNRGTSKTGGFRLTVPSVGKHSDHRNLPLRSCRIQPAGERGAGPRVEARGSLCAWAVGRWPNGKVRINQAQVKPTKELRRQRTLPTAGREMAKSVQLARRRAGWRRCANRCPGPRGAAAEPRSCPPEHANAGAHVQKLAATSMVAWGATGH
jgi:hypothetical protein